MTGTRIVVGIQSGMISLLAVLGLIGAAATANVEPSENVRWGAGVAGAAVGLIIGVCGLVSITNHSSRRAARRSSAIASLIVLVLLSLALFGGAATIYGGWHRNGVSGRDGLTLAVLSLAAVFYLVLIAGLQRLGRLEERAVAGEAAPVRGRAGRIAALSLLILIYGSSGVYGVATLIKHPLENEIPAAFHPTEPAAVERFADLGFEFRSPGKPWVKLDSKALNPSATLTLTSGRKQVFFMIIAERIGARGMFDAETLAGITQANAQSTAESLTSSTPMVHTVAGIQGRRWEADARMQGLAMHYVFWVGVDRDFAYQLMAWGPPRATTDVVASANELFGRFALIDAEDGRGNSTPAARSGTLSDPTYGVTLQLEGSGWTAWEDVRAKSEAGTMGAKRGKTGAMMVVPIRLGGLDPNPDALAKALLDAMDFKLPGPEVTAAGDYEHGAVRGQRFVGKRKGQTSVFDYRMRTMRLGDTACLAAAWQRTGGGDPEELEQMLDRVSLSAPSGKGGPQDIPGEDRARHAMAINGIGLFHYERGEFPPSLEAFKTAADFNPYDATIVQNTGQALQMLGRPAEALAFISERSKKSGDRPGLAALRASLLAETGDKAGAVKAYGAALEKGDRDGAHVEAYVRLLLELDEVDRAERDLKRFSSAEGGPRRTLTAEIRKKQGRTDEAIAVLAEGLKSTPVDTEAGEALIGLCHDLGRFGDVVEASRTLEKAGYKTAYTLYERGVAEARLEQLPAAKASLEAALALQPANTTLKEAIEIINSRLGQGNTTAIRTPIEAVPVPDAAVAGAQPFAPEAGAVIEQRVRAVRFVPAKEWRQTEYYRVRIVDRRGVDAFSSFVFEFDPTAERLFVNALEVRDEAGAVVFTGDVSSYYVVNESGTEHASQREVLHVPVGALAPGRTLTLAVTREDETPPREFPFVDHLFANWAPVAREAVVVYADPSLVRHREEHGVEVRTFDQGLIFVSDQRPALRYEPRQAPLDTFLPRLRLCGGDRGWDDVGREYLAKIASRLESSPEVATLARRLTAGMKTNEEKVRAIASHVQQEYTYKALSFGPRAQVPPPAAETVASRYGDCKAHALLAHLLLREAGIESRLALVSATSSSIESGLPSLDQFDHVVVYLPMSKRFIDLTEKSCDPLRQPPLGLAGKACLVLDPEKPRLVRAPGEREDGARVECVREIRVRGTDLEVEETMTLSGAAAGPVREAVRGSSPQELTMMLSREMGGAGAEVRGATAEHSQEPEQPLVLRISYRVPRALVDVGGKTAAKLPFIWERRWFGADYLGERSSPFELRYGTIVSSVVHLKTGTGLTLASGNLDFDLSGAVAAATRRVETTSEGVTIRSELRSRPGRYAAPQYGPHAEFTGRVLGALENDLLLERRVAGAEER